MAIIESFEPGTQSVKAHTTEVTCFHQTVLSPERGQLLHLSTFGSPDRQSIPKSSQSLQLDLAAATVLHGLLEETFPSLKAS
jgi:hypothetical protein